MNQAVEENLDQQEFLYRLLHDEAEQRDGKQLALRLARANFEHERTLEDFDFHFNPGVPRAKVIDLATCAFVDRHEVVLLLGATSIGWPGARRHRTLAVALFLRATAAPPRSHGTLELDREGTAAVRACPAAGKG